MIQTLLLPGLDGSPAPHWQHWWAQSDPTARIVEQGSWSRPCPDLWLTEIAGALLQHPGAVLVGHSLGAVAAVKLLTQWPQLRVSAVLLVAPAETTRDPRLCGFGDLPERPLPVAATMVASRDDPWMSFPRASALARAWGAELVDMGRAGHINAEAGFGPWPEGKRLARELAARATRHPGADARGHFPETRHEETPCQP
ncbi:RBBP9/YdeN family alpha/beta hydrolase [Pseudodonghicola sp.]|uniref:RBBP9/YdeN family alpha/beta hydrolase n=1 Tax=Pseudodonghicola sp. TaxID=1969463 RepID=UPI003A96E51D